MNVVAVLVVVVAVALVMGPLGGLRALRAAVRLDRAVTDQRTAGGRRQEVSAARADLRSALDAMPLPLPERLVSALVDRHGWVD